MWSTWTSCSQSCGIGTQSRDRQCNATGQNEQGCTGSASERRACYLSCCAGNIMKLNEVLKFILYIDTILENKAANNSLTWNIVCAIRKSY